MAAPIRGIQVFTTTHGNKRKMCSRSLHAVRRFMHVYLHTQTAVHTCMHLTSHGFDCGKNLNTPNSRCHCNETPPTTG